MIPVSQINIGGDPLLGAQGYNIEEQLRQLELRKQSLESMKQLNTQAIPQTVIWNEIDAEIKVLSPAQIQKLFENEEYVKIYTRIQELVNAEILNLVKYKIESSTEGNQLLRNQLDILKKLKTKILEDTDREVALFKQFKEFSKTNPNVTYDEFLKAIK
jgi:hypothetical protein